MEIEVRCGDVDLMEALRAYLQRRVRFRFDRHPDLIRKITVRLEEQKTARAEGKKLCRISAELIPSGQVSVSETPATSIKRLGAASSDLVLRSIECEPGNARLNEDLNPFGGEPGIKDPGRSGGRRNARAATAFRERTAAFRY